MSPLLEKLRLLLLPTISRHKAKLIARAVYTPLLRSMTVHEEKPDGWRLYGVSDNEPCWFIHVPWDNGSLIQSSRVVVVSRLSGKVLYSGTAQDEG